MGIDENKKLLEQKIEETKNLILLQQQEKEKGTNDEENEDQSAFGLPEEAAPTDGDKVADGENENKNNLLSGTGNDAQGAGAGGDQN